MRVQEESVTLRVSANFPGPLPLWSVARYFELLDDVVTGAVALEETARSSGAAAEEHEFRWARESVRGPTVTRLRMDSPLLTELLFGPAGASVGAVPFVIWLITHSEQVGASIPKFVRGWKQGWSEVRELEEKSEELDRLASGVKVTTESES